MTRVYILTGLLAAGLAVFGLLKSGKSDPAAPISNHAESSVVRDLQSGSALDPLMTGFQKFSDSVVPSLARSTLSELHAELCAMDSTEAVERIRTFLRSGQDKPTGLSFEIKADGTLQEWPTFRTFLLDTLLAVDPSAAATLAREILTTPTTADEWALALRNLGKVETSPETNRYLRERTEALIKNPHWQAKPSIGYLNAFDLLVHTQATESTPLLSTLIQGKDRKDLAHASFLTLDRLVQKSPVDVLTRLAADTALQQNRPEMVAQQFARADLRDPLQQSIVKRWLLDPARTSLELRSFAGVFPNNNRFVSNNLLTRDEPPKGADLSAHDREALQILHAWAADSAFSPLAEYLPEMIRRLEGFVGSPNTNTIVPANP